MRSIATIGDLKLHEIHSPNGPAIVTHSENFASPNQGCWFPGGAMFLGMAIEKAVSYASPAPITMHIGTDELLSALVVPGSQTLWTATNHVWPGEKHPRLRLAGPKSFATTSPPVLQAITAPLPARLIELLQREEVPEILVINDLGLFIRELPLFDLASFRSFLNAWTEALPQQLSTNERFEEIQNALNGVVPDRTAPLRTAADYYSAAWWSRAYATSVHPESLRMLANAMILRLRRAAHGLVLHNILTKMQSNRQSSVETDIRFRLSPLIIISINAKLPELQREKRGEQVHYEFARTEDEFDEFRVRSPDPARTGPDLLRSLRAQRDKLTTVWNKPHGLLEFICRSDLLAQHSVFVLNASELRSQEITISEGLSWERSAQELEKAFREHPQLRKLSRVRHIIVRFGATGLFHVHNSTQLSRQSDLYFDPIRDDRSYRIHGDGRVIGHQSVVVASLIQTVTLACHRGNGGMLPVDLGPAIADALPHAIRRSQAVCTFGYDALLEEARAGRTDPAFSSLLPSDIFEHPIAAQYNSITTPSPGAPVPLLPAIGHTRVASEFFDDWSIAVESLQPDILQLCHDVVQNGVLRSLNLPTWTVSTFVSAFRTAVQRERNLKTLLCDHQVGRLFAADPDPRNQIALGAAGARTPATAKQVVRELCRAMRELVWALSDAYEIAARRVDNIFGCFVRQLIRDEHFEDRLEKALAHLIKHSDTIPVIAKGRKTFISTDGFLLSFFDALRLPRLFDQTNPLRPAPLAFFEGRRQDENAPSDTLIVLDRREIEGTRFIRNLIEEHLKGTLRKKPLPIAVFGPPGAGKTFAIKQIVNSITAADSRLSIKWVEDNLAQKTSFDQLTATFDQITDAIADKHIPVVFFDEFDSSLDGTLSWLKLFLAPMEDGTYNRKSVGGAILVFAGGTSETFRAFSREDLPKESTEWLEFSGAKGPDFVSRLHGHLDIIGINHSGPIDRLYPLRRAIVLRSKLEGIQQLGQHEDARIEKEVLYALMNVPRYRHGARSLRNLLNLFPNAHEWISRSALPPRAQAEMHVDAEAFWDLLFSPNAAQFFKPEKIKANNSRSLH